MSEVAESTIDESVAEAVLGWTRPTREFQPWDTQPTKHPGCVLVSKSNLPRFSTDIKAAWRVIRHLNESGMRFVMEQDWGGNWSVRIARNADTIEIFKWYAPDELPLAICLAALKACGVTSSATGNHD